MSDTPTPDELRREADATNHAWWEERAPLHPDTEMYRRFLARLREGGSALTALETAEVGDVAGLDLVHLQCHVGTDTLSLANLGAGVTGIDFSEAALVEARRFARELDIPARFVRSGMEQLADRLEAGEPELAGLAGKTDVVFTSWGTITWYRDVEAWARAISLLLRPGGRLHLIDGHPMLFSVDEKAAVPGGPLQLVHPYFATGRPLRFVAEKGTYADPELATSRNVSYDWPHPLSEILGALLGEDLVLESFGEHQAIPWPALPCMVEDPPGTWRLPDELADRVPLAFSLRARKPAARG